jgi:hypothetical protein
VTQQLYNKTNAIRRNGRTPTLIPSLPPSSIVPHQPTTCKCKQLPCPPNTRSCTRSFFPSVRLTSTTHRLPVRTLRQHQTPPAGQEMPSVQTHQTPLTAPRLPTPEQTPSRHITHKRPQPTADPNPLPRVAFIKAPGAANKKYMNPRTTCTLRPIYIKMAQGKTHVVRQGWVKPPQTCGVEGTCH